MSGNGLAVNLADVEAQVDAYRARLLAEKWEKHDGKPNPQQWPGQATPGPTPAGDHDPKRCAASGQSCVWPACVLERAKMAAIPPPVAPVPIKLDLGCGKAKKEGFTGVDVLSFPGVDVVCNLGTARWPWEDSSVDEAHSSHTVEHLQFTPEHPERIHFVNELWRVLKPGGKATIVVPHWASCRYYGDYTHRQVVSEFWPPYLSKAWRTDNAPHNPLYSCDFDCTQPGYSLHPELQFRNTAFQQMALTFGKEAAQDMTFTLIARK